MSELKRITISGILNDLENGLSRPEIAEKYEISPAEVKAMFEHPKLKGKKAKKKLVLTFQLEDDTADVVAETATDSPVKAIDPPTQKEQEEVAGESFATPTPNDVEDTTLPFQ